MKRRVSAAGIVFVAAMLASASCSDAPTAPTPVAQSGGLSADVTLTTTPAPPATTGPTLVQVTPSDLTLAPGETTQLTVALCRGAACSDCTARAHWETLGPPAATIQQGGLVSGHVTGDTLFRASCDGPFNYVTARVRLPDSAFGRRAELTGGVCAAIAPDSGWDPDERCPDAATDTQSRHFIAVTRAGWLQVATRIEETHSYGDGVHVELRCGDRLLRESYTGETFAIQAEPCRYELKFYNRQPYGQRYFATVQAP